MPIPRYGVLSGRPSKVIDATKKSPHYQIQVDTGKAKYRIAVNVKSQTAPSEVLYYSDDDYQHEILAKILEADNGFTELESKPGDIAIDFVRGNLFDTSRMRPLPATAEGPDNDLNESLDAVIDRAMRDPKARLFAFGQGFPGPDEKEAKDTYFKFSPEQGVHDIHMNQGNEGKRFAKDDGAWQDGALFVYFPSADRWSALFLAFQSQSFQTDDDGHAAAPATGTAAKKKRKRSRNAPMAPLGESLMPMSIERVSLSAVDVTQEVAVVPAPSVRPLKAYAFDPSLRRHLNNEMQIELRYEPLVKGPAVVRKAPSGGFPVVAPDAIAVVDYDASAKTYYKPVDLDDPSILIRGGLEPSESNPLFHQQMVYAVVTETVQHFQSALGRRLHWRRADRAPAQRGWMPDDIRTLHLYPHAMRDANAFYSPDAHGILFGYFRADMDNPGRNLPGQPIFTCLSHDIVVHETTHAILDGLRGYFLEQTNVDVAAFHEAFADLAALFRHFSHKETLLDTIRRTGGKLYDFQLRPDAANVGGAQSLKAMPNTSPQIMAEVGQPNPLVELAQQFGEASGLRRGLRSALGTPSNSDAIKTTTEPHARGSILVAAVFDAFFTTYVKRTASLFQLWRAGGFGGSDDVPESLAKLLSTEAASTADGFFRMCVRALDYCPPIDITFGDFLRAAITAHVDYDPVDADGVRDAWMEAFRARGILADGAHFFSEEALSWPSGDQLGLPPVDGLKFGDPNCITSSERDEIAPTLYRYCDQATVRRRLKLDPRLPIRIPSFHPVFTLLKDGSLRTDMVVEVVQTKAQTIDHQNGMTNTVPFRGGATLIITHVGPDARHGVVRYVAAKSIHTQVGAKREALQQRFLEALGPLGNDDSALRINFALVHGGL